MEEQKGETVEIAPGTAVSEEPEKKEEPEPQEETYDQSTEEVPEPKKCGPEPSEEPYDQSTEEAPEPKTCEPDSEPESSNAPKIITGSTAAEIETEFEDKERENEGKVEAALFISGRFLNLQELIMLTDINPIMLKEILNRLEKKHSMGAVRIVARNQSWKMDVAEKYHYLINKLATGNAEFTKAEQETLAIIAYKQPIKQSVIIKIRGNKAYDHIKKFREIGLVTAKRVGHTLELNLSEEFYEYFNVHKREGGATIEENKPSGEEGPKDNGTN
ncbi:SMC-Scp complex subunit ScpB [archaeon]|mgnify:CR=1 FL=1|jgi:segregation and condensation protein B|nr:SMC-Scp complex subunit ScpB [archaeon]MBT3577469.1 SMC-Scp complex subunit ScpB [archaeon]MBT6820288.1 SMC-Scp complex subunit ScpB [archaeon]MBT6955985.1 SMC-Scp complex subunit ScpB [archaeon]MBT7025102.1 SMC-Scp complex subunit ScpB [archaeon]